MRSCQNCGGFSLGPDSVGRWWSCGSGQFTMSASCGESKTAATNHRFRGKAIPDPIQTERIYEYGLANKHAIAQWPDRTVQGNRFAINLPPMTILPSDVRP